MVLSFGVTSVWAQMDHGSMQGGSPPPEVVTAPSMAHDPRLDPIGDARDPHAYSGGYTLPPERPLRLMDEHSMGSLMVDRLESVRTRDETSSAYELTFRYGRDYDRAVLKAEGHVAHGDLEEASTELLWSHAVAAYWDAQLGVRHDSGEGLPGRNWLAFGVQGLAPYWFEIDATAYLGENGRSALRLEAEYELLLTQRLALQPRLEAGFYGKRDDGRGLGSGLAEGVFGLRLRYEIKREIAPYVGVERVIRFGETADIARAAGADTAETRWVAGLRFWY
jgi:copper resistance protein B